MTRILKVWSGSPQKHIITVLFVKNCNEDATNLVWELRKRNAGRSKVPQISWYLNWITSEE